MDANTACVLRIILRHYPCTKLCVKQHSGLSMSTVLRAVDLLAKEGWITVDAHPVPSGGKPHAELKPSERAVYGAVRTAAGWDVCALRPTGEATRLSLDAVDDLRPLTVVGEAAPAHAEALPYARCVAAYLSIREDGAYVDEEAILHTAAGTRIDVGRLPSPLLSDRRLSYREAFGQGTPQQKIRLQAELTEWITTLLPIRKVYFADQVAVAPAVAAAWTGLAHLMGHL